MSPTFFTTASAFRVWLARHHQRETELLVGFYTVGSGRPSLTYPEALDEALCVGWIDGVRKRRDDISYTIRFTPRKKGSYWSAVNIRKAQALIERKRMKAAGLAAYGQRDAQKAQRYAYEKAERSLTPADIALFRTQPAAWRYFEALPPGMKRVSAWYVISAKKPETRARRLALLIACSAKGERLPGLPQVRKK